ncbi:hypothetical protein IB248_30310 [Rhizobium sp. RHZ01]|nr:hypothetical protein [Rhizobium sp. RHZ01]
MIRFEKKLDLQSSLKEAETSRAEPVHESAKEENKKTGRGKVPSRTSNG